MRSRRPWEAIDLGFRMVRLWWGPLYGAWMVLVAPVLALWIWLAWEHPWWTLFGLWWLKPLYERVPLHVLSEALFGAPPRVVDTVRALPRWIRGGTLFSLLGLRGHPARSMVLPTLQLERLKGARGAMRRRLIVGFDQGPALALLLACGAFQLFPLALGAGSLAGIFLPKYVESITLVEAGDLERNLPGLLHAFAIGYAVTLSCVTPLYVASGFALYINRRIFLEGWDIDLVFRKLAQRMRPARGGDAPDTPGRAGRIGLSLGLSMLLLAPRLAAPEVAAEDVPEPCRVEVPQDAKACIEAVVSDPVFGGEDTREVWGLKEDWGEEPEPETRALGDTVILSWMLRAVVLIGLAVLVMRLTTAALRRARQRRPTAGPAAAHTDDLEAARLGLRGGPRADPGALPDDPVRSAHDRFGQGDPVGALSLLYRAALADLSRRGIEMPASATEYECARRVRGTAPAPIADDFDALVRAWEFCAYGSRAPDAPAFDALCARWQRHLLDPAA